LGIDAHLFNVISLLTFYKCIIDMLSFLLSVCVYFWYGYFTVRWLWKCCNYSVHWFRFNIYSYGR